jgi:transcriptional regulator with XRE-family HTH domain
MNKDYPDFVKDFIAEVKEEMKLQGMNNSRLADRMGVSRVTISAFFYRNVNLRYGNIQKMAEALGMNVILCLGDKE